METGKAKKGRRKSALVAGGEKFVKIMANLVDAVYEVGGKEAELDLLDKPGTPLLFAIARLIHEPNAKVIFDPEERLVVAMVHAGIDFERSEFDPEEFAETFGHVGEGQVYDLPPHKKGQDWWTRDEIEAWLAEKAEEGLEPATLADGLVSLKGIGETTVYWGSITSEGRVPAIELETDPYVVLLNTYGCDRLQDSCRFLLRRAKKPAAKEGGVQRSSGQNASAFKLWGSVTIGGVSADDFLVAFGGKGYLVGDHVPAMMTGRHAPRFTVEPEPREIGIVVLSVAELGFPKGAVTEQILDRGMELGLELCPPSVGPHVTNVFHDRKRDGRFLIAMDRLRGKFGGYNVFEVGFNDGVAVLTSCPADRYQGFGPDRLFAFVQPCEAKRPAAKASGPREQVAEVAGPKFTDLTYWRQELLDAISRHRSDDTFEILRSNADRMLARLEGYRGLVCGAVGDGHALAHPPKSESRDYWTRQEVNEWLRGPEVYGKGLQTTCIADGLRFVADNIASPYLAIVVWGGELKRDVVIGFRKDGSILRMDEFARDEGVPHHCSFLLCRRSDTK